VALPVTFQFQSVAAGVLNAPEGGLGKLPKKSGVFRIFDVHDNLILLERTHNLAERIDRFYAEERTTQALDLREITGKIEFCQTDSAFETLYLLHAERKHWFPKTYHRMKTFPRFYLLKINPRQRFPRIYATRQIKTGVRYFGPFQSRGQFDQLKTMLERTFRLRPCGYNIRGNDPYPDCLYFQMRTCSKPCNNDITRDDYLADIDDAITFIKGQDEELRQPLVQEIERLATNTHFEDAARLQKKVERIERARKDHRGAYHDLWAFDCMVVMEAGSTRRRKVAFVRGGAILALEEHEIGEIQSTLEDSLKRHTGESGSKNSLEQWYEDFCLVSTFMTQPVKSVKIVQLNAHDAHDAHDGHKVAVESVLQKIEEDRIARQPKAEPETGPGPEDDS